MCEAAGMTVGSWRSGWEQGWGLECSSMEGLHLWELELACRVGNTCWEQRKGAFWGVGMCLNAGEQRDKLGHPEDVGKVGAAQIQGPALH